MRGGGDCQHQGGRELGSDRMVNICKLSINVVNDNKPKMLIGLAKKASGLVRGLYTPLS